MREILASAIGLCDKGMLRLALCSIYIQFCIIVLPLLYSSLRKAFLPPLDNNFQLVFKFNIEQTPRGKNRSQLIPLTRTLEKNLKHFQEQEKLCFLITNCSDFFSLAYNISSDFDFLTWSTHWALLFFLKMGLFMRQIFPKICSSAQ